MCGRVNHVLRKPIHSQELSGRNCHLCHQHFLRLAEVLSEREMIGVCVWGGGGGGGVGGGVVRGA